MADELLAAKREALRAWNGRFGDPALEQYDADVLACSTLDEIQEIVRTRSNRHDVFGMSAALDKYDI